MLDKEFLKKLIVEQFEPLVDEYCKSTKNPFDDLAWMAVKRFVLTDAFLDSLFNRLLLSGMAHHE